MRLPFSPVTQRHVELHQPLADWFGDMLGVSGLAIWWQRPLWVIGFLHDIGGATPQAEALFSFNEDPECAGLEVSDGDVRELCDMLLRKPDARRQLDALESGRRSDAEEAAAEDRETEEIGKSIARR